MRRLGSLAALVIAAAALRPVQAKPPATSSSRISGPWLHLYTLEPYSQYWHARFRIKDLKRDLPSILEALKKARGESVFPLQNMASSTIHGYQQLSYRFSIHDAEGALRKLRKLAVLEALVQAPSASWNPGTEQEVREKLKELQAEQKANQAALQKMPVISTLASELAAHLTQVERNYGSAKDRVLIDVEIVEEQPSHDKS